MQLNNYEPYFVYLKTGVIKQQEREYLENSHEKWKIIDRKTVLNLFNKFIGRSDNNIFQDYVNKWNSIDADSKSFSNNTVDKWDFIAKEGFFYELDNRINEWTGWNYVNNQGCGFLGLWWHFVRCKDKPFEYYLQLQDLELFIRIILKEELSKDKLKETRNESIYILENLLMGDEKSYIKKPSRLGLGKTMAIKQIDQKAWLIKNSNGIVDIDKTVERLNKFSSILDRSLV